MALAATDVLPWVAIFFGGGGMVVAGINAVTGREGRRAEAANNMSEADNREREQWFKQRDQWFKEANDAYARLNQECTQCREELRRMERDLDQVKDALLDRVNAFDAILPTLTGVVADQQIADIRSANRSVKRALYEKLS